MGDAEAAAWARFHWPGLILKEEVNKVNLHELHDAVVTGKFLNSEEEYMKSAVDLAEAQLQAGISLSRVFASVHRMMHGAATVCLSVNAMAYLSKVSFGMGPLKLLVGKDFAFDRVLVDMEQDELPSSKKKHGQTMEVVRNKAYAFAALTPSDLVLFSCTMALVLYIRCHAKLEPGVNRNIYGMPMLTAPLGSQISRYADQAAIALGAVYGLEPLKMLSDFCFLASVFNMGMASGFNEDLSSAEANYCGYLKKLGSEVIAIGVGSLADCLYREIMSASAFWLGAFSAMRLIAGLTKHMLDERSCIHVYAWKSWKVALKPLMHLITGGLGISMATA
jgi:hypothetical protein